MTRLLPLLLCTWLLPSFAAADDPESKEQWLVELRKGALESMYPDLVRKVLFVIYDYGYVQGMKHGVRSHNDQLRWAQTYYKSCVERANDAEHEPACAEASKIWADALLEKLGKQIEAHGLPVGKKPG